MAKVLGAIFFLLGILLSLFIVFLYLNTSAHLSYNADKLMLNETGLVLPSLGALGMLIVGYIFLFIAKED